MVVDLYLNLPLPTANMPEGQHQDHYCESRRDMVYRFVKFVIVRNHMRGKRGGLEQSPDKD